MPESDVPDSPFQSTPPCAGGDPEKPVQPEKPKPISIHAPLCGGRHILDKVLRCRNNFNPRPPVRGATLSLRIQTYRLVYFNPRPPVRGRPFITVKLSAIFVFQSTPPRAGGDVNCKSNCRTLKLISIHAPLCGGRRQKSSSQSSASAFQSTPPCAGGDILTVRGIAIRLLFQSTPPCAGGD